MDYYVGNGVYDYLIECNHREDFFWTSGNMWLLTYGNEDYEPKVVTVVSENELGIRTTEAEQAAVDVAKKVTEGTGIPVNFIRFAPERRIETVQYWEPGMKAIPEISSNDLKKRFIQYGLRMNQLMAQKSINDKSSSPYHDWQRSNMGSSVIVADIELLRFDGQNPTEILELKRSYIAMEEWEPYRQDYKNFFLLSKLARKRDLDFYIVYNHRTKNPFYDDISRLKVFEFDHRTATYCRLLGYRTIQQFADTTKGEEE